MTNASSCFFKEIIAPFKIHLIDLGKEAQSQKIYQSLQKVGIEVLYDNRKESSAGEKFADADLVGIPWRAIVSEKTDNRIELKKRNEKKTNLVNEKELLSLLKQ